MAIVGASNETMVCTCIEPTLSSIDYGFARVGFEACEVLVKMVNGEEPPESPILLSPADPRSDYVSSVTVIPVGPQLWYCKLIHFN